MKRVLKIGGQWKGLMLAVLILRIMLFECIGCVAVFVEQRRDSPLVLPQWRCLSCHDYIRLIVILYLITPSHACIYILFKKSKMHIKIFKTPLHVSITRSSSGSIYCYLLKLQFKTFSELLRYVNLVLWQHACKQKICLLMRLLKQHNT